MITQVLLSERVGGAETLAESLRQEWARRGIDSEIVYVDPPGALSTQPLARAVRLIRSLASPHRVVLAHTAIPAAYARLCAIPGARIYSVLHSGGDDFAEARLRLAERVLRTRTHGVIAVSELQAARYRARFGDAIPVNVIPNGIGRQFRLPATDSAAGRIRPRTLGEVARLVPQKNPELWLHAVSAVMEENPELSAEWWGPSEDYEFERAVRQQAKRLPLNVEFHGATSDPVSAYRRLDVLVHASSREAHSVGLLEAAAMGVPILCSEDVAATLPEYLHVATFRTGDRSDLTSALRSLLSDWGRHRRLAESQAERVANSHDVASTAQRYLDLFEPELSLRRKRRGMHHVKSPGRRS